MTVQEKKYLREIQYSMLSKWYVSYYINPHSIRSSYDLVHLKNLISPRKEVIKKNDFKNNIPVIAKISFKDGKIHLRDESKTGMNLYKISKEELLVSKINFHQGAVSINHIGDLVCSTHYQPYFIDKNLISNEYLILSLRSKGFLNFIQYLRADGIKNEATYEFIGDLAIPLPSLTQQNALVEAYNEKIQSAKAAEEKALQLESEIEEYLMEELGIEKVEKEEKKKGLQEVWFKDLERWDASFLLGNLDSFSSKFSIKKIEEVIQYFLTDGEKSLRINTSQFPDEKFSYIGMEHIEKETGTLLESPEVKGSEIKSQTVLLPPGFFLYGKLRPYLNKYYLNRGNSTYICSSEFFSFKTNDSVIDSAFSEVVISSKVVQSQIADKFSGARMPRINEETFKNIKIPLPPLPIQQKIVEKITALKDEIKSLKAAAVQSRREAIEDFEREIFSV